MSEDERHKAYIAIWSKAVETQMHFNEMSVKSRQLGLTFVTAALGVSVVLYTRGIDYSIPLPILAHTFQLHVSVLIILGALLGLMAVRKLDLGVYHGMLRGAVTFGEDFEENYMKEIFHLEKGMTQAISHYSRYKDASVIRNQDGVGYKYHGTKKVTAYDKIKRFYNLMGWALLLIALFLFFTTNYGAITDVISSAYQTKPAHQAQHQLTVSPDPSATLK